MRKSSRRHRRCSRVRVFRRVVSADDRPDRRLDCDFGPWPRRAVTDLRADDELAGQEFAGPGGDAREVPAEVLALFRGQRHFFRLPTTDVSTERSLSVGGDIITQCRAQF